jgi:hypothetical protein
VPLVSAFSFVCVCGFGVCVCVCGGNETQGLAHVDKCSTTELYPTSYHYESKTQMYPSVSLSPSLCMSVCPSLSLCLSVSLSVSLFLLYSLLARDQTQVLVHTR